MTCRPTCGNWRRSVPRDAPRRTSPRPTPFAIGSPSVGGRSSTTRRAGGWSRSSSTWRRPGPWPARDVVSVLDQPRHRRRVDPLGRRGVAAGRAPGDRFVPGERGRPRRPLRRRGCDGRARHDVGRRRGGGAARAGHRMGRRPQRRPQAVARPRRPRHGRLHRGDGRRARPARSRPGGSHDRRLRSVRHRDARPPRVRRDRRPGRRRDRGLLHGVPARDPHDGRAVRREVPLVPHRGHRVLVPRQGPGPASRGRSGAGRAARASDVVRDAAGGPREVVEAELLPVPGSMA